MDPVLDLVRVLFFSAATEDEVALVFAARPGAATMSFGRRLSLTFPQRISLLKALKEQMEPGTY